MSSAFSAVSYSASPQMSSACVPSARAREIARDVAFWKGLRSAWAVRPCSRSSPPATQRQAQLRAFSGVGVGKEGGALQLSFERAWGGENCNGTQQVPAQLERPQCLHAQRKSGTRERGRGQTQKTQKRIARTPRVSTQPPLKSQGRYFFRRRTCSGSSWGGGPSETHSEKKGRGVGGGLPSRKARLELHSRRFASADLSRPPPFQAGRGVCFLVCFWVLGACRLGRSGCAAVRFKRGAPSQLCGSPHSHRSRNRVAVCFLPSRAKPENMFFWRGGGLSLSPTEAFCGTSKPHAPTAAG